MKMKLKKEKRQCYEKTSNLSHLLFMYAKNYKMYQTIL